MAAPVGKPRRTLGCQVLQQVFVQAAHRLRKRGAADVPVECGLDTLLARAGQGALCIQHIQDAAHAGLVAAERDAFRLFRAVQQVGGGAQ